MSEDKYKDFIAFRDEHEQRKEIKVKIIDINSFGVIFETQSSNIVTIPAHRVFKIKQEAI